VQAAPAAGLKNYINSMQIVGTNTTAAAAVSSVVLISGGARIWESPLATGAATQIAINVVFDIPISGGVAQSITCSIVTANTLTGIVSLGNLLVNAQGYVGQ
jgi:hypothetical protein